MSKDFKGTDLRDGADAQETEYKTPGGSMCGVDIPAGSYTVYELAAMINTRSQTHTAKVIDGRVSTREAQRRSDDATLQPMTSTRSPGETLIELLIDIDMINEGAFSAAEYSDQIAALNRAADKLVAPYLARIAELEGAYRGAANERDIVSARDDAKSLRIAALEADLATANARAAKLDELLCAEIKRWFEANDRALVAAKGRTAERERADKLEAENKTLLDAKAELEKRLFRYPAEVAAIATQVLHKAGAFDHVHELGSCSYCDKGGAK